MLRFERVWSKTINHLTGGLMTSTGVVLVVLVLVFVLSPGGGFLVLVAVVACHYVYYH